MSLEEKINNLGTKDRHLEEWSNTRIAWLAGFDTGLYEAGILAAEADELMLEMAGAIASVDPDQLRDWQKLKFGVALEKYNSLQEKTNERD